MPRRDVIVHATSAAMARRAVELGFHRLLVTGRAKPPDGLNAIRLEGATIVDQGKAIGRRVQVRVAKDQDEAVRVGKKSGLVWVDCPDWKIIPLENLVARLEGKARVWAAAASPREARSLFATLERGVDGVVIRPTDPTDLARYLPLLNGDAPRVELTAATVTRITRVGTGDRVCVDTCSLLGETEGLLVGSTGQGFFLVGSEARATGFVNARPFRVNAGAVHSYVLDGNSTHYLSEIHQGQPLTAVDARGRTRSVVVGRAKTETRPLVLVEARSPNGRASIILQDAETIRLLGPRGRSISVDRLRKGDTVLVHLESGARHTGLRVTERIREA